MNETFAPFITYELKSGLFSEVSIDGVDLLVTVTSFGATTVYL